MTIAPNRAVAIATPLVFAPVAGAVTALAANNGPGPEPWCGDFMAWCYRKAGSKAVTRAWASVRAVGGLAGVKRAKSPLKGNLVRFNFDHIRHVRVLVRSRATPPAVARWRSTTRPAEATGST